MTTGSMPSGLFIGLGLSGFIAEFLIVFIIASSANYKEAYNEEHASNHSKQDIHGSFKRV